MPAQTPTLSTPLPASAQSAYAEILEVARHQELSRSVEGLSGSFNKKTVKGATYWYYQFTDASGAGTRQLFVGRDSEKLRDLVARAKTKDTSQVERLAKGAIALGCAAATPVHFRIVRRLNEIGFFHAGGVLIGSHAFLAYGNSLGVSWGNLARTQDIDFAHAGNGIALALPTNLHIDTRDAIEHLEAGFLPVPGFRPKDKTASFISKVDRTLRVDFLTPMVHDRSEAFRHEGLGVNLQPIRFMEFLLEDVDQAVVLSAIGAVVATIPDPARYALHKLLVHAERRKTNAAKAVKDLQQAAALIEVLSYFRDDDLVNLWRDLLARGPGWRSRARTSFAALEKEIPGNPILDTMRSTLAKSGRATSPKP